ncbi:nucleotidyltransferase family protein [Terracidiphilus gabretensis]|uniref:nucleotidyltransferase family protein n=1 Tax=Terracidiphilus gabretensis TaxID=1577687 RepID=UPI001E606937|nr:nucleotidyltransferase family protein [Terracidiphilus gabretensis]
MTPLHGPETPSKTETWGMLKSASLQQRMPYLQNKPAVSIDRPNIARERKPLSRVRLIRRAVLLIFLDPIPDECQRLFRLTGKEWHRLFYWLDVSGLALYLLDRLVELGLHDRLPPAVVDRLRKNTIDNEKRTQSMVKESIAIQREFQRAGHSYAVLKGLSLCPNAVPRPELRHQFDLDFLVSEKSIFDASKTLQSRGYRLYAISGKSWEFRVNEVPHGSLKDMYKPSPEQAVELHVEPEDSGDSSRLSRVIYREVSGILMPVLSPVDLFLGHALHAFKDVSSPFSRASHLLEFYRHIASRRDDPAFWLELRCNPAVNRKACLGIGVVTYLLTSIMGDFAPRELTDWTVQILPPSVRLWVDVYGHRIVFGKPPGTKLHLLLKKELENAGLPGKHSLRKILLPLRLPLPVIRATANETLSTRIARYRLQCRVILSRLLFHLREGTCYFWESFRWRQLLERLP